MVVLIFNKINKLNLIVLAIEYILIGCIPTHHTFIQTTNQTSIYSIFQSSLYLQNKIVDEK